MRATKIAFLLGITLGAGRAQQAGNQNQPRRPESPPDSITENTVTIGGQKIEYRAIAGTITVGATDTYDALIASDGQLLPDVVMNPTDVAKPEEAPHGVVQIRRRRLGLPILRKPGCVRVISGDCRPVRRIGHGPLAVIGH